MYYRMAPFTNAFRTKQVLRFSVSEKHHFFPRIMGSINGLVKCRGVIICATAHLPTIGSFVTPGGWGGGLSSFSNNQSLLVLSHW